MEPVRNPLAEVRWWGFLTGDAYANPFHDLLYAFSRSAAPAEKGPDKKLGRSVSFSDDGLTVTDTDQRQRTHKYASLTYLKLDHTDTIEGSLTQQMAYFTRLKFGTLQGKQRIELRMSERSMLALCDRLLRLGVPFKEYLNGMRSFRQKVNYTYDEIQLLKRDHGIEW